MVKTLSKKLLAILLIAILTVFIYYAIIYSIKLCYSIIYDYVRVYRDDSNFVWSLFLYYTYILPSFLAFTNLMLALVEKKIINRIVVFIVYLIFIFLYWNQFLFPVWPYRAIPVFCLLTGFYIFDILAARFIVKKILHKDIL
jgi:hypothetical protein